ncbi:astacin-like [Malaya genurostris]|uniref:astacin-like n=1 Tax=Malaya genurostris TaxID=325434 RepID=UPI0026F3A491|nr:astacin-like [Malaya genurostris]
MFRLLVGVWFCFLAFATIPNLSECYYKPSKAVGVRLAKEYSKFDRRYPFEFGLGHYYQGDIILKPQTSKVVIRNTADRWPKGIVPYKIVGNFTIQQRALIMSAMNQYHTKTCVRFVPFTNQQYYVSIGNSDTGCYSYVGYHADNNYHQINLQTPYCTEYVGTPVHEMLHALGAFHEFTRPDRDDWLNINRSALLPEYQTDEFFNTNFGILSAANVEMYNIKYNYGSVMHYSKWAGAASLDYPVMMNKKAWFGDFGSNAGLKQSDIEMVLDMYCKSSK